MRGIQAFTLSATLFSAAHSSHSPAHLDTAAPPLPILPSHLAPPPIPALPPHLSLVQSQVLFRHGARAPVQHLTEDGSGVPCKHASQWHDECPAKEVYGRFLSALSPVALREMPRGPKEDRDGKEIEKPGWWVEEGKEVTLERKSCKFFAGNCVPGQLTILGAQQGVILGSRLRDHYIATGFLGKDLTEDEIFLRSTTVERTVVTAQGVIKGMYPQTSLSSRPFPIHIHENAGDTLFPSGKHCPALGKFFERQRKLWTNERTTALLEEAQRVLGTEKVSSPLTLRDHIVALEAHGKKLPEGITMEMKEEAVALGEWQVRLVLHGNEDEPDRDALTLAIGRLVREMRDALVHAKEGTDTWKLMLFSAHDTTIMPLLGALEVSDGKWPPFASYVIMELLKDNNTGEHFVRMVYNGELLDVGKNGETLSTYDDFIARMSNYVPEDYEAQCAITCPVVGSSAGGGVGTSIS